MKRVKRRCIFFLPVSVLCGFTLGRTSALGDLHKRMKEQCPDGAVATFLRQA